MCVTVTGALIRSEKTPKITAACGLLQLCRKSQLAEHKEWIETKSGTMDESLSIFSAGWRMEGGHHKASLSPTSNFSTSVRGKLT